MTKTSQRTAVAAFLGLLVGLAGGAFFFSGPAGHKQDHPTAESRPVAARATQETPSRQSVGRRERTMERLSDASPPRSVEIDPAVLIGLVQSDQATLEERVVLFSDGDLIARALAMSTNEKAALESEWTKVKDEIVRLQRKTLRHEQGEDHLWIGAGPFDGTQLRASFREAAIAILGPERGEALLGMTQADKAFGEWGRRTSAAYSIQYDRQSDGSLVYRITEKDSPESPAGRSWISNRIPAHIREVTDFLGILPEAPNP